VAQLVGAVTAAALLRGLVSGDLHAIWVYLLAPVVGAVLGGLAYQFVRGEGRLG
jgi:glycerol uptake facilitator-like aquaporin